MLNSSDILAAHLISSLTAIHSWDDSPSVLLVLLCLVLQVCQGFPETPESWSHCRSHSGGSDLRSVWSDHTLKTHWPHIWDLITQTTFRGVLGHTPWFTVVHCDVNHPTTEPVTTTSPDSLHKLCDFKSCLTRKNSTNFIKELQWIHNHWSLSFKFSNKSKHEVVCLFVKSVGLDQPVCFCLWSVTGHIMTLHVLKFTNTNKLTIKCFFFCGGKLPWRRFINSLSLKESYLSGPSS